jgi:uncharacterized protein YbjT (DUF2867 family)
MRTVFITGGTGYMGSRLIQKLIARGHEVIALVRKGSEQKLPAGVKAVIADPFRAESFQQAIPQGAVFVQLLGVPHPSPRKKELFHRIDLPSVKASADAAAAAGISHFVYVSVAMTPSKIMKDFQAVRKEGEDYIRSKALPCTFIRPWYVLGPGHWWPILLLPLYGLASLVPSLRAKVKAFGLVTIGQMIRTLVAAVEAAPGEPRLIEIEQIRKGTIT